MGSASSAPKAAAPAVDPLPAPVKRRGSLSKVEIPGAVTPKAAEGVMLSIVTNKTERKLFETYLANEFCEEIIRFWKATETFQRHALKLARVKQASTADAPPESVALAHPHLLRSAEAIYAKYLAPGAPEPVNVSAKVSAAVRKTLDGGAVSPDLFVKCKKQLLSILSQGDKFRGFAQWADSDAALEQVLEWATLDDAGRLSRKSDSTFDADTASEFSDSEPASPGDAPPRSRSNSALPLVDELARGGGVAEARAADLHKHDLGPAPSPRERKPSLRALDHGAVQDLQQRVGDHYDVDAADVAREVAASSKLEEQGGGVRLVRVSEPIISADMVRRKSSVQQSVDGSSSDGKSRKGSVTLDDLPL